MKYCKSCHTYYSDEDEVCGRCGGRLEPSSSSSSLVSPRPSSASASRPSATGSGFKVQTSKPVASTHSSAPYIVLTASSNKGIGLWTSICVSLCSLFGIKSNAYDKKIKAICGEIENELIKKMKAYPNYDFSAISFASDSRLSYIGTAIGTLKK